MSPEEFQGKYYLATGIEIDLETSTKLLSEPTRIKSWFVNKIVKMAEPTVWGDLQGTYTQKHEPTEEE